VPGTYEWTVPRLPYIIVREENEESEEIVVLGVFHGAQFAQGKARCPPRFLRYVSQMIAAREL
jgi:hypothetical protein